jgi:hypothetical protein
VRIRRGLSIPDSILQQPRSPQHKVQVVFGRREADSIQNPCHRMGSAFGI